MEMIFGSEGRQYWLNAIKSQMNFSNVSNSFHEGFSMYCILARASRHSTISKNQYTFDVILFNCFFYSSFVRNRPTQWFCSVWLFVVRTWWFQRLQMVEMQIAIHITYSLRSMAFICPFQISNLQTIFIYLFNYCTLSPQKRRKKPTTTSSLDSIECHKLGQNGIYAAKQI